MTAPMEHVSVQGVTVPALGLGTWRLTGEECREAVRTALDVGYRHLDTAQAYQNERAVGAGLRDAPTDREDVFLTTKLAPENRSYDDVIRSTEESLAKLGTDHVDLLLIHQPNDLLPFVSASTGETLDAMNQLVDRGAVRHVGVSNFSVDQLHEARRRSDAPLLTNQVQFHPWWDQTPLLDYCDIHDVLLTAYSPLSHGGILTDPVVTEVAEAHGKSPAQVALRWVLQHPNTVTIPKATSREHIVANLDVFDFELSAAEMERIRRPSKLRTLRGFARSYLPA